MTEELVIHGLKTPSQYDNQCEQLIHHSDRGGQYAGKQFRAILRRASIRQSMSRAGDCYDNAFMESCFGTIKTELEMTEYENVQDAELVLGEYFTYYNCDRKHSGIGYQNNDSVREQSSYSFLSFERAPENRHHLMPCIKAVLNDLGTRPDVIVIDGYVWLDAQGKKGLGAHLFELLNGEIPVIGVAKTSFATATNAIEVFRGQSSRPLWVTAIGTNEFDAAKFVRSMHGNHRIQQF